MPAAEESVLLVAEDDAAVGEVGVGRLVSHRQAAVAVERQWDPVVAREFEQPGQDVGVAVGADEQVWVVSFEQIAHAVEQVTALAALELVGCPAGLDDQVAAVAAARIAQFTGEAQRHDAQGR